MSGLLGPKAQRLRAMREAKANRSGRTRRPVLEAKQPAADQHAATPEQQETTVKKTTKTKTKAKAKGKTKVKRAPKAKNGESKTAQIAALLSRASGCTSREVLDATGWPSVSMPALAVAAGLKLRKEKVKGSPTRYYGEA